MKIINISPNDNSKDILDAVKEIESDKIILVVPKSNKVFKNKKKTFQLKEEFKKLGKKISVIFLGEEKTPLKRGKLQKKLKTPLKIPKEDEEETIESFYHLKPMPEKETRIWPEIKQKIRKEELEKENLKKFILIFFSFAIPLFLFLILTYFGNAKIKIIPKKENFSLNIPLTISKNVNQPDSIYGIIPGQIIEFEKTLIKNFQSGGEKEIFQKAKGKIIIYNQYSTSPQILIATTRFQTPEGLIFRIPNKVVVPGISEGKPGTIEAEVIADRAGEEYNIEPTQFTIPGFLGTPKYQGFYAKSFEKFKGGFTGKSKFVTKEDLEKARGIVGEEIINLIKDELLDLKKNNLKILDNTVNIEVEVLENSSKVNDLGNEFKFGLKAKVKTMAFKEEDIIAFISKYIEDSQGKIILERGLSINYIEPKFDREKGEIFLKLISSGQAVNQINKDKIIDEISGKKRDEVKRYFDNLEEIESAKISIFPFWKNSIPKEKNKVKVEIIQVSD